MLVFVLLHQGKCSFPHQGKNVLLHSKLCYLVCMFALDGLGVGVCCKQNLIWLVFLMGMEY